MINNIIDVPLVQDLIIDVTESQLQVAYAIQYDNNVSTINCHIQDEGVDLDLSDYKITLRVKKSNGKGYSATIGGEGIDGYVDGNIVSFKISEYMTTSLGRQICDLEFFKNDESRKFSCTFYLRVGKGSLDDQEILDSDYYASVHDEYLEVRKDLDDEVDRATQRENEIENALNEEITRSTEKESELDKKISDETTRAKQTEIDIQNAIDTNKPNWDDKYTKNEVDDKLNNYALLSESGFDLGLSIDPTTYIMTLQLKNKNGSVLSSKTIDFPLETMVVGASYNKTTKQLVLTLQNGSTTSVDISDIVGGLVSDTFTIAGIDMKDNITAIELKTALGINNVNNTKDADKSVKYATSAGKVAKPLTINKAAPYASSSQLWDGSSEETITQSDYRVYQENTTASSDYRLLFSQSANDTSETDGARKSSKATFNPSTGELKATKLTGQTGSSTVTFDSLDAKEVTQWTEMSTIQKGMNHSTLFQAISVMFKNVRFLKKVYDILNSNLGVINRPTQKTLSVPSGTNTEIAYIDDIEPGVYFLVAFVRFPSNNNGIRQIEFMSGSSSLNRINQNATTGNLTCMNMIQLHNIATSFRLSLYAYQNSGSTLSLNGYSLYAYKITPPI